MCVRSKGKIFKHTQRASPLIMSKMTVLAQLKLGYKRIVGIEIKVNNPCSLGTCDKGLCPPERPLYLGMPVVTHQSPCKPPDSFSPYSYVPVINFQVPASLLTLLTSYCTLNFLAAPVHRPASPQLLIVLIPPWSFHKLAMASLLLSLSVWTLPGASVSAPPHTIETFHLTMEWPFGWFLYCVLTAYEDGLLAIFFIFVCFKIIAVVQICRVLHNNLVTVDYM